MEPTIHNFGIIFLTRNAIIVLPCPFRAVVILSTATQGGARRLACRWAGIRIPFGEKMVVNSKTKTVPTNC